MKLKTIIVDDEPIAIDILKSHSEKIDYIEVVGEFRDALSAFNFLKTSPVDLIFLDIQMPQMTGLQFLETLDSPPKVILTTAYKEYALQGYEHSVIDYLMKPIPLDRFVKACEKVISSVTEKEWPHVFIKSKGHQVKIIFDDVLFVESLTDHVQLITKSGIVETDKSISYMDEILPKQFLRIHRSYIVNLHHIQSFTQRAIFINNEEYPIGRKHQAEALERLNRFAEIGRV